MNPKFPLSLNDMLVHSSEHLYQCMRFSEHSDIQQKILAEKWPMKCKFIAKEHINKTRNDWNEVKLPIMSWVVALKTSQHFTTLKPRLLEDYGKRIVEYSKKDDYWGAVNNGNGVLIGHNYLGRIWTRVSTLIATKNASHIHSLAIAPKLELKLLGEQPLTPTTIPPETTK